MMILIVPDRCGYQLSGYGVGSAARSLYAQGLKWEAFLVLISLGVAFFPMKLQTPW
jgi:hypothetical protein